MRLIIIGVPAAGKGTQASKISENLGIPHISTGDIFRYNIKNETPLGINAKMFIDQGCLVPDDLTQEIVKNRLMQEDCGQGFILDGFPRTIAQAEFLGKFLENSNLKIDFVFNLEVDDSQVIHRISGRRICSRCNASFHVVNFPTSKKGICDLCNGKLIQRDDDKEKTVLKRIQTYHEQTKPLITYYSECKLLIRLDGHDSIQKINDKVLDILGVNL